MPASVTMNDGMPTYAIQKPWKAPMSPPATRAALTAAGHGRSYRTMSTAADAPVKAAIEPTDRSMWPLMITMTMPMARIRI